MEAFRRPVGLPQRAECVGADAVEVKVVTAVYRASAVGARTVGMLRARTMPAGRAVVPVSLGEPAVPAFVHAITERDAGFAFSTFALNRLHENVISSSPGQW